MHADCPRTRAVKSTPPARCVGRRLGRLLIDSPSTYHQQSLPSRQIIMSAVPSTSSSHSNFVSIFDAALETYKRKTKQDLTLHPLISTLQSCHSPDAILTVLRDQIPAFDPSQSCDDGLTKWVIPTVNVLFSFSETVSKGIIGLVNVKIVCHEEDSLIFIFRHSHRQL